MCEPDQPPTIDPAGVVTAEDPPPGGWLVRIIVSAFEVAFGLVLAFFGILTSTSCDGSFAGTDVCDGMALGEVAFLVVLLMGGGLLGLGAVASLWSSELDRRRWLYRAPVGALLVAAAGIAVFVL